MNLLEPYFLLLESVLYCYDLQPRNFVRSNPKRHPFPFCAGIGQEVFNILLPIWQNTPERNKDTVMIFFCNMWNRRLHKFLKWISLSTFQTTVIVKLLYKKVQEEHWRSFLLKLITETESSVLFSNTDWFINSKSKRNNETWFKGNLKKLC